MYLQTLKEKKYSFSTKPQESIKKKVSYKSEFFSPCLGLCSWKQTVVGSIVWRASQSFDVMLSALFFMWSSWKKLSVSRDRVLRHTLRVCFVTTTTFWHSSAAQDALKKVKKLTTKYFPLFPILALTTTFLDLPDLWHGLHSSLCTFKKREWNPFSSQPKPHPSLHHTEAVTCVPQLQCCSHPTMPSTFSQGRKPLVGWTETQGEKIEEELLRKG